MSSTVTAAGAGNTFSSVCSDKGGSCDDFISDSKNVQDAYWVVNYVDVYQETGRPSALGRSNGYHGPAHRTHSVGGVL